MTGCVAKATPLPTVEDGVVVTVSFAAPPAMTFTLAVVLVRLGELKVMTREPVTPAIFTFEKVATPPLAAGVSEVALSVPAPVVTAAVTVAVEDAPVVT